MRTSKAPGPTACLQCAQVKAKCVFQGQGIFPSGKCTRCNRLSRECTLQTPAPRRGRKPKFTPMIHLEDSVNTRFNSSSQKLVCQQSSDLGLSSISLPVLRGVSSSENVPSSTLFTNQSVFFGPTSFSAAFQDHQDDLDCVSVSGDLPTPPGSMVPIRSTKDKRIINVNQTSLGVRILLQIPNQVACDVLFSRHINPNDGWIRLAGQRLSSSIWPTFGNVLNKPKSPEFIALAELLCRNTKFELREETDYRKWFESFSEMNFRWEALGILFTYWAFGVLASVDGDPVFASAGGEKRGRKEVMIEMKECATSCIALCSHSGHGNALLVYLLYKHSFLESMISGDASLMYWRQHADLCSMVTALGMHRDVVQTPHEVNVSSEMKRRIYAAVFNIDKVISTFTGRPPMLSYRYNSTPLPLDLSDEQLLSDPVILEASVARLDGDGWSPDGQIYSTTILRARTSLSMIRGQILDIALCSISDNITDRVSDLKQHSHFIYADLPSSIAYRSHDLIDSTVTAPTLYSRIVTRLEHLQNLFLLERLNTKHKISTAQELIHISLDMIHLTSSFWKLQDRLSGLRGDFEWLIMYHAVPASGILCVELLKQLRDPTYSLTIPRSDAIQDLILFNGFLDWVKPEAPNFDLCRKIREIVGKVLQQILEALPISVDVPNTPLLGAGFGFETGLRDFDDYAALDLLDTFDWVDESWRMMDSAGLNEAP